MKEEVIDGINYRLDEENLTAEVVKKSGGYEGDIIIPETVFFETAFYRVTSIGEFAFYECSSLTAITIPDSIIEIRRCAFSHCEKLTSITIPDGVEIIDECAFSWCISIDSVVIPDSVVFIGDSAFSFCKKLTSIKFFGAAPWMRGINTDWYFASPAKIIIVPTEM